MARICTRLRKVSDELASLIYMVEDSSSAKKRVTLRDIARQANVSTSTVSRVLNNYPYVDETTRLAVREAAQTLNYPLENLRRVPDTPRTITLLARDTDRGKSQVGLE